MAADISSRDARASLAEQVRARHGALNALVNNAGRAPRVRGDLLEASEESFEELMRTNLQGPYFLTQALSRDMVARREADASFRASIVFVTSVSADMASPNRGEYCVSKAGLAMAAKLFAVRLAASGIPVYEVRPGIISTDMTAGVQRHYDQRIADGLVPERRWGTPDDVGSAVAALVRGDSAIRDRQRDQCRRGARIGEALVHGSGFRFQGSGFRFGFRVQGSGKSRADLRVASDRLSSSPDPWFPEP